MKLLKAMALGAVLVITPAALTGCATFKDEAGQEVVLTKNQQVVDVATKAKQVLIVTYGIVQDDTGTVPEDVKDHLKFASNQIVKKVVAYAEAVKGENGMDVSVAFAEALVTINELVAYLVEKGYDVGGAQ